MPLLIGSDSTQSTYASQNSFIERVRAGRVVPIISDEALFDLALGGYSRFVRGYANKTKYPLDDIENLVRMAKFYQLKKRKSDEDLKVHFRDYMNTHVYLLARDEGVDEDVLAEAEAQADAVAASAFAKLLGYPRFDQGTNDLLLVLADLPIKVYLTTSPYTFIEDALRKANKQPRTEVCRWRKELDSIDSVIDDAYKPSDQEPLVYHLHGLDQYPDSLIVTEDDYLEFLVNVVQGQGNNAVDRVHALVRKALSDDLIILGFRLNSWAFRMLHAGLIKPNSKQEDRGVCALQLVPSADEKRFLEDYVQREAKFDVFWGDLNQYAQHLHSL